MNLMKEENKGLGTILGFATIGPVIVGIVSLVGALFPFFDGDFIGSGVLLIASALSFGLLSIAVLGK